MASLVIGSSTSCPCLCLHVRVWSRGSCSLRQGMVCHGGRMHVMVSMARYSGTMRVMVVHLLYCATWVHSGCHVFHPCALYPRGASWRQHANMVAILHGPPALLVAVALSPTIRGRIEGSLARMILGSLTPSRESHARGGRGCTLALRVKQGLGGAEPCSDVAQSWSGLVRERGAVRGVMLRLRTPWSERWSSFYVPEECARGMRILSGQVHLMCQPPPVLPERSRPRVVQAAACCVVRSDEWSMQAMDASYG